MSTLKSIKTAFVSVWHKDNLEEIIRSLHKLDINIYSTGGTAEFIDKLNIPVTKVETLTGYPSILGGRVKTLHPKIFGGILARRNLPIDAEEMDKFEIPYFDLVVVDLYPFEKTLAAGASDEEIIEKIDIGGISLIRAAAKNFTDVLIIPSIDHYSQLLDILVEKRGQTSIEERRSMAGEAYRVSSKYDTAIWNYFNNQKIAKSFTVSFHNGRKLRYGENPHQDAFYYSQYSFPFMQLHGKEISYNNLLDIDAAFGLINEFRETTFAVLKHNNACGLASRSSLKQAWIDALAGDPVSAFGGVLITNAEVDKETAEEINKLFFEVIIAPSYENEAINVLKQKKSRIILSYDRIDLPKQQIKSVTGGILVQNSDLNTECEDDLNPVTSISPGQDEICDLIFANKIVKHSKSNAIVLAKNKQLIGSGVGQTSRIDALKQAIKKAGNMGFELKNAVMASDAFFPFADSVNIAHQAGISSIIQPGGSVRDQESIDYCNNNNIKMVFTGIRHFKH